MTDPAPVLIAGAGIGGLTLAAALGRRGIPAHIVERAPVLEAVGAGVQLSPNAGRFLDGLGLGPALDAVAVRPQGVTLVAALRGSTLADIPLGDMAERRWGAPYRVLHRADLQAVLLDAARDAGATIEFGAEARAIAEGPDDVSVEMASGEARAGAFLVGADGLRSIVRRAVKLPTHVEATGLTAWRAVLPAESLPRAFERVRVTVWLAPGAHMVVYPVRGGREANVVLIGADGDATPDERVRRWAAPARELVAAVGAWTPWRLFDRLPDPRMRRGRIALIGDAAHAALPSLAQGAASAIEDAAVLARLLAGGGPDPLGAYEKARLMRVGRLRPAARRQIAIDHLGGLAAVARDIALRAAPARLLLGGLDWMYGWRDETDAGGPEPRTASRP